MALRIVRPETVKLDLADGEWLIVKKRLTAGEARRVQARMIKSMAAGEKVTLDPMQVGRSQAIEYLLDWSISVMPIRDKSADDIGAALDALDAESFTEISKAIQDHEAAMDAAMAEEKKMAATSLSSAATTPSAA